MGAIGCRSIIYYALLSFTPLFLVANLGQSESFASAVISLIAVLAASEDISCPSAVALGQSFVPHHLGMASGISFGVMVCIGGIASPALGLVGDGLGLQAVMFCMAAIAFVGVAIAAFIPTRHS